MHADDDSSSATSHRSPLGTWERAWQRPRRSLRGLVDGYVGYRQRLATPASHRGHDRYVIIDAVEHHGIQVDLRPPAAFRWLGRPLHDLTGQIVSLEDALGRDAHRLADDLASAPDWPTRFRTSRRVPRRTPRSR